MLRWFWISDSPVWDLEIPKPIISQSQPVSGDIFICRTKYRTFAQHDFQNTWASAVPWFDPGKHSLNRGSHSIFGSWHLVCLHIWFLLVCIICLCLLAHFALVLFAYLVSVCYIFDFCLLYICFCLLGIRFLFVTYLIFVCYVFDFCLLYIWFLFVIYLISVCIFGFSLVVCQTWCLSCWLAPRDTHSCSWTAESAHHLHHHHQNHHHHHHQ